MCPYDKAFKWIRCRFNITVKKELGGILKKDHKDYVETDTN